MKKRNLVILVFLCLLTGCMQKDLSLGNRGKETNAFQTYFAYETAIDTPDGFYYADDRGFLYYFDYAAEAETIVCNRPNCKHEDWSERTPKEERCSAYVGGTATGFENQGKLYLMESDYSEDNRRRIRIVESDLDRTNQREVSVLDCDSIFSYAVKDHMLYAVIQKGERVKNENGSWESGSSAKSSFCRIDLTDGTMDVLWEREGYSNVITILAAWGNTLYLEYSYFEQPFDGTNYKEARQHAEIYAYSLEGGGKGGTSMPSGEIEEILTGFKKDQILGAAVVDGTMFVKTAPMDRSMNEKEETVCALKKISLSTEEETLLAETSGRFMLFQTYAVYTKDNEAGGFVYDFQTEKEIAVPDMKIQEFYPNYTAGEYIYGYLYHEAAGTSEKCFILRSDLMEGKDSFLLLHDADQNRSADAVR